jgi:hypothetical protein
VNEKTLIPRESKNVNLGERKNRNHFQKSQKNNGLRSFSSVGQKHILSVATEGWSGNVGHAQTLPQQQKWKTQIHTVVEGIDTRFHLTYIYQKCRRRKRIVHTCLKALTVKPAIFLHTVAGCQGNTPEEDTNTRRGERTVVKDAF